MRDWEMAHIVSFQERSLPAPHLLRCLGMTSSDPAELLPCLASKNNLFISLAVFLHNAILCPFCISGCLHLISLRNEVPGQEFTSRRLSVKSCGQENIQPRRPSSQQCRRRNSTCDGATTTTPAGTESTLTMPDLHRGLNYCHGNRPSTSEHGMSNRHCPTAGRLQVASTYATDVIENKHAHSLNYVLCVFSHGAGSPSGTH